MITWRVNIDEALVCFRDGVVVGGVWRGAWIENRRDVYGVLAAVWVPQYRRVGRFLKAADAKVAVEAALP